MSTCEARKGFLTLSNCENTAVTACSNCGRSMCPAHLAPTSGFTTCLDCAATTTTDQEGEYDDVWSHRYRNSYYTSTGYTPMDRTRSDTYYDSQDAQSFKDRGSDSTEDEVEHGGFGES